MREHVVRQPERQTRDFNKPAAENTAKCEKCGENTASQQARRRIGCPAVIVAQMEGRGENYSLGLVGGVGATAAQVAGTAWVAGVSLVVEGLAEPQRVDVGKVLHMFQCAGHLAASKPEALATMVINQATLPPRRVVQHFARPLHRHAVVADAIEICS